MKLLTSFVALLFILGGITSCASKTRPTLPAAPLGPVDSSAELAKNEAAPGVQTFTEKEIVGKAFSVDGASVQARAIISVGESRRPVFVSSTTIAYATKRPSFERWQVFVADLAKKFERRVSFDAGDAEPVGTLGHRLVIATTSDERKSGERVLGRYREIFIPATAENANASVPPAPVVSAAPAAPPAAMQHLILEHPATGRKGTEWNRMSHLPARQWFISTDQEMKQALVIADTDDSPLIFKVVVTGKPADPNTRQWIPLKVELPATVTKVTMGRIFPDGTLALWSNGSIFWTTTLKGGSPLRIGDDSVPAPTSFTIDPTGQWIVFSSASESKGQNLMALHRTGRCLKTLTALPGDETDPSFSPDGQSLLFIHKQGDSSAVAQIPFGTTASIAAACP